jgi:hypothetical protein
LTLLYVLLLAASLAYRYVGALKAMPSIGQFLDPAGYVALGGLFLQWRRGHLSGRWAAVLAAIAVPLELYSRLR